MHKGNHVLLNGRESIVTINRVLRGIEAALLVPSYTKAADYCSLLRTFLLNAHGAIHNKNTKYVARRLQKGHLLLCGDTGFDEATRTKMIRGAYGDDYEDQLKHHMASLNMISGLQGELTGPENNHDTVQASLRVMHLMSIEAVAISLLPLCRENWSVGSLICARLMIQPHLHLIRAHAGILMVASRGQFPLFYNPSATYAHIYTSLYYILSAPLHICPHMYFIVVNYGDVQGRWMMVRP